MNTVGRLVIALLIPALAMLVAAGGEALVTQVFPALGSTNVGGYAGVVAVGIACGLTGYWLCQRAQSRLELIFSEVVPVAWGAITLWRVFSPGGPINWGSALVWFILIAVATPALGIAVGWLLSGRLTATWALRDA